MAATKDVDMNDLRVFLEVMDRGSFTAAAKELGVPTSTVSRKIARLEESLGARLLQRTTRKLSPTDAGRLYYERSSRAVADIDDATRMVTDMQSTPRGRLRVTAPVEFSALMGLIADFLSANPEVQIDAEFTNRYVDLVKEGFDVALRAGNLSDSSLVARKLADSQTVLVASPEYLERKGTPTCVDHLRSHDAILRGSRRSWTLVWRREEISVPLRGRIQVNNMQATLAAAIAGLGIAFVPVMEACKAVRDGRLVRVLPEVDTGTGTISAVYPSREFMSPALRAFIDHVADHFDETIVTRIEEEA